jgi:hypothetical protein
MLLRAECSASGVWDEPSYMAIAIGRGLDAARRNLSYAMLTVVGDSTIGSRGLRSDGRPMRLRLQSDVL